MPNSPDHRRSALTDALKGAVAGAIGTFILDRVDWFMYNREAQQTRDRTQAARPGGRSPTQVMVDEAADAAGAELSPAQSDFASTAVHYGIGIAPGALYGVMRDRVPGVEAGRGALYGLGLFLVEDEVLNPAFGFAGAPGRYPWQDHARGLIAHLVYGVVTDAALRAMDQIDGSRKSGATRPPSLKRSAGAARPVRRSPRKQP